MSDVQHQPSRIELLCAQQRLRMTGQRRVIARVLSEARDHPDVEELHRRAHAVDPRISLSTVYRTVRLFQAKGILERHEFSAKPGAAPGLRRGRYEGVANVHHDHLIDTASGRVIEFRSEEIEQLQERIALEHGFRLIGHRLELYGVPVPVPVNVRAKPRPKPR